MKLLVLRPPQVLSYFNAGHHLALYQVADALRKAFSCEVDCVDASVERSTWKDLADRVYTKAYDVVFLMNDLDGIDGFDRSVLYVRELSPSTRIVTFGRLSSLRPDFFRRFDLDFIIRSGDFEAVCCDVVETIQRGVRASVSGTDVRRGDRWIESGTIGRTLDPEQWCLPDPKTIPYDAYGKLYSRDSARFSGFPNQRELVVPVARGCPVNCSFCEVPIAFGRLDRRISVARTLGYIADCISCQAFDYVSFYAPTFTLDRAWVRELCETKIDLGASWNWKCCTTVHHLSPDLIELMGQAGCVRISVGVETLEAAATASLPRIKQQAEQKVEDVAAACAAARIELNCFVIVGLPGSSVSGTRETMAALVNMGARVRPTAYTPYSQISTDTRLADFNRQLLRFADFGTAEEKSEAYGLLCISRADEF